MNSSEDLNKSALDESRIAISSGDHSEEKIRAISRLLEAGLGGVLVSGLVDSAEIVAGTRDEAVSTVMARLESLQSVNRYLASCLMAYLWGIASEQMMHDVCDAIALWMTSEPSAQLRAYLEALLSSTQDPDTRRHIEGWLSNFH